MSEKNKALVARIPLEAFNQGKLEVIDEVIADNSVEHWAVQDQLGMLQQLGFSPTPEAAAAR